MNVSVKDNDEILWDWRERDRVSSSLSLSTNSEFFGDKFKGSASFECGS